METPETLPTLEIPSTEEDEHNEWHAVNTNIERYRRKQRALCQRYHFADFKIDTEDEWFLSQVLYAPGDESDAFWGLVYTHQRYGRPLYVRLWASDEGREFLLGFQYSADEVGCQVFRTVPELEQALRLIVECIYKTLGPVEKQLVEVLECAVLEMLQVRLPLPLAKQPLERRVVRVGRRQLRPEVVELMQEEGPSVTSDSV